MIARTTLLCLLLATPLTVCLAVLGQKGSLSPDITQDTYDISLGLSWRL